MLINGEHLRKRNEKMTRNIVKNNTKQDLIWIPVKTYFLSSFILDFIWQVTMLQTVLKSTATGGTRHVLNAQWSVASRSALAPQLDWRASGFSKFWEFSYVFVSKSLPLIANSPLSGEYSHGSSRLRQISPDWGLLQFLPVGAEWHRQLLRLGSEMGPVCVFCSWLWCYTACGFVWLRWVVGGSAATHRCCIWRKSFREDSDVLEKLQAHGFCC